MLDIWFKTLLVIISIARFIVRFPFDFSKFCGAYYMDFSFGFSLKVISSRRHPQTRGKFVFNSSSKPCVEQHLRDHSEASDLENAVVRLLNQMGCRKHDTPGLCHLRWLPFNFWVQFKVIILISKALYGLGPGYLINCLFPWAWQLMSARVLPLSVLCC